MSLRLASKNFTKKKLYIKKLRGTEISASACLEHYNFADQMPKLTKVCYLGCDKNLAFTREISESKTFATPGFPRQYENNLVCRWYLSVPAGRFIRLTFDQFQTEPTFDFVTVRIYT